MTINYIRVYDLHEYENNPRHNDKAVEAVANSILNFGFKVPLVIDRNNIVVTGHTRLKAAKLLGINEVPCIIADDLSEEQITAFRLVDNKTQELAGWDYTKLDIELETLKTLGVDMDGFGFDQLEGDVDIDNLFDVEEKKEKQPKKVQCQCCGEWFEV